MAKTCKLINRTVMIINFNEDTRYSDSNLITTHDKISLECFSCGKNILDAKSHKSYEMSDVICINEGQFFDNLVKFCIEACAVGKEIHVCGLDGDYLRNPFGEILNLIPHCDEVKKLKAVCMSCKNGTFPVKVFLNIGIT